MRNFSDPSVLYPSSHNRLIKAIALAQGAPRFFLLLVINHLHDRSMYFTPDQFTFIIADVNYTRVVISLIFNYGIVICHVHSFE